MWYFQKYRTFSNLILLFHSSLSYPTSTRRHGNFAGVHTLLRILLSSNSAVLINIITGVSPPHFDFVVYYVNQSHYLLFQVFFICFFNRHIRYPDPLLYVFTISISSFSSPPSSSYLLTAFLFLFLSFYFYFSTTDN
jgi:hypothetical protein